VPPLTTELEGDDEEAQEYSAPEAAPRGRARLLAVVTAIAVVLALVASVMTASYIRLRSDRDAADADRTRVATTATQVVEAMFAVDADSDNKQQADVIHTLGTGPLIEQYEQVIPSTRDLLKALGVASEHSRVTDGGVFVGDVDDNEARVVVVVDLVVIGKTTKIVPNQYLRIHLVKLDGSWKVDNIENVNVALAGAASDQAPPTSSSSSG
jgi:hypothetical protein